jgi:hypothetical protein
MSVTDFVEDWQARDGSFDVQPPNGRARSRFVRTYRRVFKVRTDDTRDGPITVMLYACDVAGFLLGSAYFDPVGPTYDAGALLLKMDPKQDQDDPFQWMLTLTYTSDLSRIAEEARDGSFPKSPSDTNSAISPLLRPPKIRWGTNRYQRVWQKDLDGKVVANSAGDPFDPPVTTDDDRPVLTVTRCMATFDIGVAYQYRNAVNSDVFMGAQPGQLKIVGTITGESAFENNLFFWDVTGSFEFNADGWTPYSVLNAGYHYLSDLGDRYRYDDDAGQPLASPGLLAFDGSKTKNATYASFRFFNSLPFAQLGFFS